jgi:Ser/Thr protein kinase RdoA (MazF antagonist)
MPLYYSVMGIPRDDPERRADAARAIFVPFLAGYREEHALAPFWIRQIPGFLRFRDLELYLFYHKKIDVDHMEEWQAQFFAAVAAGVRSGDAAIPLDYAGL